MSIFSELGIREGKDREGEEFLYNLAMCYGLIEKEINTLLGQYDLSAVKMNALLMIKHVGKDKGLSQNEICKRMIVTPGNITRLLDRLQKEGWVERLPSKSDRRVNLIRITPKASTLLDKVWPSYRKKINEICHLIPSTDRTQATQALHHLRLQLSQS